MAMPFLDKRNYPAAKFHRMCFAHSTPLNLARSGNHKPLNLGILNLKGSDTLYATVQPIFHKLLHHCGIAPRSATCRPRIHDLRHSFAVSTIAGGYRTDDPGSRLAILSTYLGHAGPGDTYWYLSAAPELLALAGERLERHLAGDV